MNRKVPSDVIVILKRLFPDHYTRCQPKPNIGEIPSKAQRTSQYHAEVQHAPQPEPIPDALYEAAVRPRKPTQLKDVEFKTIAIGTLEELVVILKKRLEESQPAKA